MLDYWKFKQINELFVQGHFEAARRMLKMVVQLHVDKDVHAGVGQCAEQEHFSELLRTFEPESKRKMYV